MDVPRIANRDHGASLKGARDTQKSPTAVQGYLLAQDTRYLPEAALIFWFHSPQWLFRYRLKSQEGLQGLAPAHPSGPSSCHPLAL